MVERDSHVGEGHFAVPDRYKVFTMGGFQQFKNTFIQNFPGSDLLFYHIESGLFEIHTHPLFPHRRLLCAW
jgi:hypothetical protein